MGIPRPGEVHEELLARLVLLAHDDIDVPAPTSVELAELAVGVAVGEGLFVLEPQQHERDVGTPELEVHLAPVRHGTRVRRWGLRGEQAGLEGVVVQVLGQRPGEPRRLGPPDVVGHGGERDL